MGGSSYLKSYGRHLGIALLVGLISLLLWIRPSAAMASAPAHKPALARAVLTDVRAIAMGEAPESSAGEVPSEVDELPAMDATADFVPGQILVKYRNAQQAEALTDSLLGDSARLVQPPSSDNSPALIQLNDLDELSPEAAKAKTLEAIAELEAANDVIYAEPNFVYSIQ